MICPKCSFENRLGINFCEECGEPLLKESITTKTVERSEADHFLSGKCPSCGFINRYGVNYCEECGERIKQETSMPDQPQPKTEVKPIGDLNPEVQKTGITNGQIFEPRHSKLGERVSGSDSKRKRFGSSFMTAARQDLWRSFAILLLVIGVLGSVIFGFNKAKYSVTKNEAMDMANAAVQMVDPQLAVTMPMVSEIKDVSGDTLTTYTYMKDVSMKTSDGQAIKVSIGAVATVNRTTGEIEIITIR